MSPLYEHDAGGLGSRFCSLLFCCATPRPADAHDAWLVDFWLLLVFVVSVCLPKNARRPDAHDVGSSALSWVLAPLRDTDDAGLWGLRARQGPSDAHDT